MASSKVVATNLDLPRNSSSFSLSSILGDLHHQHNNNNNPSKTSSSMSMDDLLKFIYSSSEPDPDPDPDFHSPAAAAASISRQGSLSLPKEMATKTVDEVWREIVEGSDQERAGAGEDLEEMTLEDFLTKAGAVREEDVRGVPAVAAINGGAQFPMPEQGMEGPSSVEAFGNGIDGSVVEVAETTRGGRGGGRRKKRVAEEPVDKATLQKQRRMIKNRESAARSRERKQAYTVELESLVSQLEEENARLLKEEADENKQRFKQLMESIIPVVEKPRQQRKHRRVNSVQW